MGNKPDKSNAGKILAIVLITVGLIWLFQKSAVHLNFPEFYWDNFYIPLRPAFAGITHFIFSWPVIFIIVGLVLMSGRRKAGVVFIAIGGIFLIPNIIHVPLVTATLIIPVLLVTIGIILVAKFLADNG